jgi:hypothetical protein
MAYETVYDPVNCEPFEVIASKASDLVLNKGWTRSPWTRVEQPAEEPKPARGRGRQRRTLVLKTRKRPSTISGAAKPTGARRHLNNLI